MSAAQQTIGGGNFLKDTAGLFKYSDDDYNHLNDDNLNKDKRQIENGDSKKRVKTGRHQGNLIAGRPVEPNYAGMSDADAYEAKVNYLNERKKFRDARRRERLQAAKGSSFDEDDYTGDLTPMLHPMTQVKLSRLKQGQTFPDRNLIALRVAEEANYQEIEFRCDKSNGMKMYCRGQESFLVYATNSDTGWTITKCQVLEEGGKQCVVGSPTVPPELNTKIPCSPYKAAMIVPLIAKTIAETPMASNKALCQILEPYAKLYCFTEAIIQGARTEARKLIFGDADENVGYAHFVKEDLEKAGHHV